MSMQTLQVTIPASGKAQVWTNGIKPIQFLVFQNNAVDLCRVGDVNVSATRGISLAPASAGDSVPFAPPIEYGTDLSEWWIFGTSGDVIDVLFIE